MEKKKLIVIEGACDGIGKSTQLQLLKDHLIRDNESVVTHHFPTYGTYQGKPVEMYLSGEFGTDVSKLSPYFVHDLYALDRAITWHTKLKDLLEDNMILLDRYTTSSILYQSATITDEQDKKDFVDFVCDYEYNKLGIKEPDHIIFLEAPFDLVHKMHSGRTENEGIKNDIHERNIELMKRIYENSVFLADYLNWDRIECNDRDTILPKEEIHDKIYQKVIKKN